jgi:hypothetical protein
VHRVRQAQELRNQNFRPCSRRVPDVGRGLWCPPTSSHVMPRRATPQTFVDMMNSCFHRAGANGGLRRTPNVGLDLVILPALRSLSSNAARKYKASSIPSATTLLRSSPRYTVYGADCILTIKLILPSFKVLKSSLLVPDTTRKGRLLMEWVPRLADGRCSI